MPIWATYFGGANEDVSQAIATKNGSLYIAGFTSSNDLIIEDNNGVYFSDDTNENCSSGICHDAFIARYDNDGYLVWSTYYGSNGSSSGTYNEMIRDIDIDNLGNLYCVGTRNSNTQNFTRPGASNNTTGSCMVLMFDQNNQLKWATAYNASIFSGVKTDSDNRVYISGLSAINTSPVLNYDSDLAYTSHHNDEDDGYVLAFDASGQEMYSFYYGGQCNDYCTSIDVDANNNVYVVGSTFVSQEFCNRSNNLAVIDGYNYSSNSPELFAFKIDNYTSGEANISKATYFGGGGADGLGANQAYSTVSLSVAHNGSFAITAPTQTDGVFFTPAIQAPGNQPEGYYTEEFAYQGSGMPQEDVLIAYFNTNFDLVWSTYFGGSKQDVCAEVVISEDNTRLYLAGAGATNNFPGSNVSVLFPTVNYDDSSFLDYFQLVPPALNGFYPFMAMFDINGIPVSVDDAVDEAKMIHLYPNPTNEAVMVEPNINTKYKIEVYDVFGKKLFSKDNNRGSIRINLKSYSTGIYLVNILSEGETYSAKLIKL